jgi:L,D-transpeptidase ErfK/SrfK
VRVLQAGDTFLDIARDYDLGYNEIVGANPNVDPWIPKTGSELLIPTEWILPRAPHDGIVVNIPEMRLYYYVPVAAAGGGLVVGDHISGRPWATGLADAASRVPGAGQNA